MHPHGPYQHTVTSLWACSQWSAMIFGWASEWRVSVVMGVDVPHAQTFSPRVVLWVNVTTHACTTLNLMIKLICPGALQPSSVWTLAS